MKFLHLSHSKNLKSILKYGLMTSYINMDHHWKAFKKTGLKKRRCIYLWNADTYNNGKYLMDMVYTKMFIHPRNAIFDIRYNQIVDINNENWENTDLYVNFKKFGNKLYGDGGKYIVFEIDSKDISTMGEWTHIQEPGGDSFGTTCIMDDKYSHDNKIIYISENLILANNLDTRRLFFRVI